ncbi:MAG: DinB family protein [Chloroflexi bacterium]|nr:DinB family protein [Chloroflexota bacterium]
MGQQVDALIDTLSAALQQTVTALAVLSDAELDELSSHPCAMGGAIHDLLVHNIDHERMHAGQVYTARYNLRKMQFSRVDRLVAETLRARSDLFAALIGLPDDALDAPVPQDRWTIRQMIEHTIYWERNSIDDLARTQLRGRVPADYAAHPIEIVDPDYGPLTPQATVSSA